MIHHTGPGWELYQGDALDVLRGLPDGSVDAVVTDPPYTAAGGSTNGRSGSHAADTQFFAFWLRAVMSEIRRVTRPDGCAFFFCDWRTVHIVAAAMAPPGDRQREAIWNVTQALVWDRECIGLGSPFRNSFEMIAFARGPDYRSELPKNIPTVIRHRWPYGAHEHHGAEKPVELVRQLLRWGLPRGGAVLDPFAGSGTTGVAARMEGIPFIGIEMEDLHFATAEKRIGEAVGNTARGRLEQAASTGVAHRPSAQLGLYAPRPEVTP